MFVIDDQRSAFLSEVLQSVAGRGLECSSICELEKKKNSKAELIYVGEVETSFDCTKEKKFISFLKENNFKKAFLLISRAEEFKINFHFNGAITEVHIPTLNKNNILSFEYFINVFVEILSKKHPNLPCASVHTRKLVELIKKIAPTTATVLISGPSGTGKEVISNLIHNFSSRSDLPFVALNCAAIPEQMLESILFGHEKGAFTGAIQSNQGLLRAADGGTILLDEISEMPISLQSKLLRVIQEKRVMPIGSSSEVDVNVRIVATTNRNLITEVKLGNFREDLFYRLNVFPINNLPLASRTDDIIPIVAHILTKSFFETQEVFYINEDAIAALIEHTWPGNVRELDNVIQRALILCANNTITISDLIFDTDVISDQPNTAEILAAKFKTSEPSEVL